MLDDGQSVVRLPRGQATLVAVFTVESLGALVAREPKCDDGARVWAVVQGLGCAGEVEGLDETVVVYPITY